MVVQPGLRWSSRLLLTTTRSGGLGQGVHILDHHYLRPTSMYHNELWSRLYKVHCDLWRTHCCGKHGARVMKQLGLKEKKRIEILEDGEAMHEQVAHFILSMV